MTHDELPLPEPEPVHLGAHVYYSDDAMRAYAAAYHADQMRKLREAQGVSEERIAELWAADYGPNSRLLPCFAHAIADPLLARIAELEAGWQAANVQALKSALERLDMGYGPNACPRCGKSNPCSTDGTTQTSCSSCQRPLSASTRTDGSSSKSRGSGGPSVSGCLIEQAARSEAPAGWKLVPIDPTPAMSAAGLCVSEAEHDPAGVYRAMLAASPHPEAQQAEQRKPLTAAEIDRLYRKIADDPTSQPSVHALSHAVARAVERAHGITEE
jgi:hypothetical protein